MNSLDSVPGLLELCWKYIVLGAIQGLTEFLPISSTAHLKVVPVLLGWRDPGLSVSAVIQLGSILAVIAYFWNELKLVVKGFENGIRKGTWREPDSSLSLAICIGTVPIVLAGMAVKLFWPDYQDSIFRSIPSIALVSILMAVLLAFAERKGLRTKSIQEVRGFDGLIVGLGQVLALVPGVSRSGITLTTALMNSWKREDAARFSFLLGIPAITLAGLVELKNAFKTPSFLELVPLFLGVTTSALISWLAIDWLLKFLQRNNAWIFVLYRLIFGFALLGWWSRYLSN